MRAPIVVLEPGDRVLMILADDITPDAAKALGDQLRERFPFVEFSFLSGGVAQVIVEPKETGAVQ